MIEVVWSGHSTLPQPLLALHSTSTITHMCPPTLPLPSLTFALPHYLNCHSHVSLHTTSTITHVCPSTLPQPSLTLHITSTLPQPSLPSTLPKPSLTAYPPHHLSDHSQPTQPSLAAPHYLNHHSHVQVTWSLKPYLCLDSRWKY